MSTRKLVHGCNISLHYFSSLATHVLNFGQLNLGLEVAECVPGCGTDYDCGNDEICVDGSCLPAGNACSKNFPFPYATKNFSGYDDESSMVRLSCAHGYKFNDGSSAIDLTCNNGVWSTSYQQDRSQVPLCCECPYSGKCIYHCPKSCTADLKIHGGEVEYPEGTVAGAKARVRCEGTHHLTGKSACEKEAEIACITTKLGSLWASNNGPFPTCKIQAR